MTTNNGDLLFPCGPKGPGGTVGDAGARHASGRDGARIPDAAAHSRFSGGERGRRVGEWSLRPVVGGDEDHPRPLPPRAVDAEPFETGRAAISVALIEPRRFMRDCIVRCLRQWNAPSFSVRTFDCPSNWRTVAGLAEVDVILLGVGHAHPSELGVEAEIGALRRAAPDLPIIVMGESDASECVVAAIENGARGYIPLNCPFDVAVKAIQLVGAGGVYVPADVLVAAARGAPQEGRLARSSRHAFTPRQIAVIRCLRDGKPNKVIAHDLDMREGTVKVHLRNIMRKLHATNRTQIVSLTASLFDSQPWTSVPQRDGGGA